MAITLFEKLNSIPMSKFSFVKFRVETTTDDDAEGEDKIVKYIIFELDSPIEEVVGSQTLRDGSGKATALKAFDVEEVRCMLSIIANEKYEKGFVFDEDGNGELTGTGSYKGDLILDVSRGERVWLTDEKLSRKSADWKNNSKNKRVEEVLRRQLEHEKKKNG